jgi:hypothetical protein
MKKRYALVDFNDEFLVTVEIDHDVMTDERLHEINDFWSGSKGRLSDARGSVLVAVLKLLHCELWWTQARAGGLTRQGVIDAFAWKNGNGIEGWPSLDGSDGIELIECDVLDPDLRTEVREQGND